MYLRGSVIRPEKRRWARRRTLEASANLRTNATMAPTFKESPIALANNAFRTILRAFSQTTPRRPSWGQERRLLSGRRRSKTRCFTSWSAP